MPSKHCVSHHDSCSTLSTHFFGSSNLLHSYDEGVEILIVIRLPPSQDGCRTIFSSIHFDTTPVRSYGEHLLYPAFFLDGGVLRCLMRTVYMSNMGQLCD